MPIINVITHPVMVFLLNTIIIIYYYDKITKCPLLNLKTNNFTLNFLFWNKLNNDKTIKMHDSLAQYNIYVNCIYFFRFIFPLPVIV